MTWLLWRQHRAQAVIAAVVVAAFAAAVLPTGVHMATLYRDATAACRDQATCSLVGSLFQGYGAIIDTVMASIVVPLVLGVFVGATLVAAETERSTQVLAWTQSVTRRRWLAGKVTAALAGSVVVASVVSALVTWWSGTPNRLYGSRFHGAQFDTQNLVPVAYALFAVSLGIAAGSVLRRVVPAIAVTIVGYVGVRIAVGVLLRPRFLAPLTLRTGGFGDVALPSGSWLVHRAAFDPAGHPLTSTVQIPDACSGLVRGDIGACLDRIGYHSVVTYHPPGHYWPLQLMESGLFVLLAAGLLLVAVRFVLRHDA